jgi:S1-C subfamily serine protease
MKKRITGAILLALVLTCGIQTAAAKDISVVLNGKPISFDTAPCLDNGRVLVPMRGILESLGYTVEWQNDTKSVLATGNDTRILMPLGSRTVTVNNKAVSVDASAKLVGGRTLVPLRFLAEYSGAEVVWNNAEKTVNITSEEKTAAAIPAEKTIRDSMVHINNGTKKGAGLILSEDGVIATSYNFIKKSTALELTFNYGQKYNGPVKIVGLDAEKDVVLLKVEKDGLYPIKTTTKYKENQPVSMLNIGPEGTHNVFNGRIQGFDCGVIVVGISIGPGNAVLNENNEVIGMSTYAIAGSWKDAVIPASDIKAIKQNLSMSVEELRNHVYKPGAPKNLYSAPNEYSYRVNWTPINNAETYIVSVTQYSNGTCPWIPDKETFTENRPWSFSSYGSYAVVLTSSYSHADVKVKAVVDGKETDWSKTITIRK